MRVVLPRNGRQANGTGCAVAANEATVVERGLDCQPSMRPDMAEAGWYEDPTPGNGWSVQLRLAHTMKKTATDEVRRLCRVASLGRPVAQPTTDSS